MFIDAFTCCVGPVYASYLEQSLPVWMDTLDSLTVVTRPDDGDTIAACKKHPRVRIVTSTLFYAYGADFNKGAALCQAYAAMDPVDVVLHFDSDIMPDRDWRKAAEREFKEGCIHGAIRYDENRKRIVDDGPWPYGYFQLWHSSDKVAQHWPIFEPWRKSAGGYDLEFLLKWPKPRWRKLSFEVLHFGEVRRNWFGVGLEPDAQAESFRKMDEVHQMGLRAARLAEQEGKSCIKVPDFALKFAVDSKADVAWRHEIARACMTDDPFLVSLKVAEMPGGYEKIKTGISPEVIRARVEAALAKRKRA